MSTSTANKTPLNQTEFWIDQKGNRHELDEMSVRYKTNVLGFLERRAPRIVGRALAERLITAASLMLQPIPCVLCEGIDGDGTKKIDRWAHGIDHAPFDIEKYPDLSEELMPKVASISDAEAVELVRRTPLAMRLIDDIANARGGDDG
jgi:hypothetical protein